VRFSLLFASTALAASLVLSACSGGSTGSTIPGGSQSTGSPTGHHGYHLVAIGNHPQSCQSPYYFCYLASPGSTEQFGWCLSTSGNCTSGVYAGKVNWKTSACAPSGAKTDGNGIGGGPTGCTGKVKSKFGPPATQIGLIEDTVTVKPTVPYTGGQAGYNATFTATVKSGSLKGDSFTEPVGIIVGDYGS
jgi:hypothetical protein